MPELTWEGKYDAAGKRPVAVALDKACVSFDVKLDLVGTLDAVDAARMLLMLAFDVDQKRRTPGSASPFHASPTCRWPWSWTIHPSLTPPREQPVPWAQPGTWTGSLKPGTSWRTSVPTFRCSMPPPAAR